MYGPRTSWTRRASSNKSTDIHTKSVTFCTKWLSFLDERTRQITATSNTPIFFYGFGLHSVQSPWISDLNSMQVEACLSLLPAELTPSGSQTAFTVLGISIQKTFISKPLLLRFESLELRQLWTSACKLLFSASSCSHCIDFLSSLNELVGQAERQPTLSLCETETVIYFLCSMCSIVRKHVTLDVLPLDHHVSVTCPKVSQMQKSYCSRVNLSCSVSQTLSWNVRQKKTTVHLTQFHIQRRSSEDFSDRVQHWNHASNDMPTISGGLKSR